MSPLTSPGSRTTRTLTVSGVATDTLAIPPGYDAIMATLDAASTALLTTGAATVTVEGTTAPDLSAGIWWGPIKDGEIATSGVLNAPRDTLTLGPFAINPALTGVRVRCDHAEVTATLHLSMQEG